MSEIVERLRNRSYANNDECRVEDSDLMDDAADEIERLRAENEWLKSQLPRTPEAAAAGGGFDPRNP